MYELTDIETLNKIFARHGFNLKKGLGQNFLIDPEVCPKIAESACIDNEGVIEIGPGAGVLTYELAKRAKKVVAIEVDRNLAPVLADTLNGMNNVEVVFGDVMKLDLAALIKEKFDGMNVSVCANLPYYITSPIIIGLLESELPLKSITVMVQKEAAVRLCAQMGTRECGSVTAAVRYYSEPELLFEVKRSSFLPPPKVDSAVMTLRIVKNSTLPETEKSKFFAVIKASFSMRRKTLLNCLSSNLISDKQKILAAFEQCGISPTARAEQVTMEQFAKLAEILA